MPFIITRLAVSLLDSTFVPRRVYKFLCLFLVFLLFLFIFCFLFIGNKTYNLLFAKPHNLRIWHPKEVAPCVCVCWLCGVVWHCVVALEQGTFRMCRHTLTHILTCIHMSRIKTIYHLAYQARPNVHYFADAMRRIVF